MRWSFLSVVLSATVSCSFANAAVVEEFKAEDWDGMAFTSDDTGQFTHCSVFATYRNGSTLFISYEAANTWYLSISNDSWSLGEGGSFALKVRVDRKSEIDGTGVALGENQIGLPIEADHPFISQLRRGNQLVFTFQNEEYAFELSNSNKAMNAAQDCVRRHVAAGTSTPIITQPAEPPPAEKPVATTEPPAAEGGTTGTETGGNATAGTETSANATAAGEQQVFGPWVVTAANNGDGSFSNCTAFGVHGDDQLILSLYPDGVWGFGLYRAAWNLDVNQTYYLWYNVDGPADAAGVTKRPVEAAEPTRIYFEVSDLEDIIERIESGSTLNIQFRGLTGDPENYSYPLDQAPAAFEATRKCVTDHAEAAETVNKEGSGTKEPESTDQSASTEAPASTEEPSSPEEEVAETEPADDAAEPAATDRQLPEFGSTIIEEFEVPGWKAAAFSLDDGTFTHCAIKAEYQNGATLGAAQAADGALVLAVKHQDWSLETGAWVPVSFSWKGASDLSRASEGQVAEDNVVFVSIGNDAELTESLKNAREMTIEAEGKTLVFDVSDIGPGIDAIGECATRHAAAPEEAPTQPPPAAKKAEASPKAQPEPPAADNTASIDTTNDAGDPRGEAAGFTTALLFRAGYPNHVILPPDTEPPEGVPSGDALWQLGEIMGSTRFLDAGSPEQIMQEISASSGECGGEATAQVVASDATHAHFTLACGTTADRVIHYVVVPRAAGGSYVFALLGAVDDVAASDIADLVYGTAAGG
jgi:hypothetical protein